MIGLQGCASRSESNRSVHLYKLASQQTTKALIRPCVSVDHDAAHFTFGPEHDKTNKMTCAQRKLRTVWACAQSGQSLHCALYGQLMT